MNVVLSQPVEIALRTLGDEDRQKVLAWFKHLENWDNDPFIREHSHQLPSTEGVYMLRTNTNYLIFFTFERDQIVVLDIATKDTISMFRQFAEQGQT